MSTAPRVAIRLAYLGGGFSGWQRQAGRRTVQGELEAVLERLYLRPVRTIGAGRTDAGVHAAGQVAHFDAPSQVPIRNLARALNALLPPAIRILRAWSADPAFHALASAAGKRYRYRIAWGGTLPPWEALRRWHVPHRLDAAAIASAASLARGTHDFEAFALAGHSGHGARGTVRSMRHVNVRCRGRRLDLVLEADGFLRGMVRRLVGALVEVGRGAQDASWFAALISGTDARPPAPTAPPHGLTLERVYYPASARKPQLALDV